MNFFKKQNTFFLFVVVMLVLPSCVQTKKEYYLNGVMKSEIQFKNKKRNGKAEYFFSTGTTQMRCTYKNDKLHGSFRSWYYNGNQEREEYYINDTLHGKALKYYDNGKLHIMMHYEFGKPDGEYREYYENGQLKSEGWFAEGLYNNQWLYYDISGILIGKGSYMLGTGLHVSFHFNSNDTLVKTPYIQNMKHGNEFWYNKDGSIREIVRWDSGVFSGKEILNKNEMQQKRIN